MKKIVMVMTLFVAAATAGYCAQPSKKNVKKEVADSTAIVMEKAKAGDAAAQNTVGVWYYTGKDSIKQDYKQALQWWAKSAKQDNADAIGNMAMCYQLGRGTERDSALAVSLYEKAIKKGNKGIILQHETIVKNTGSVFSSLLLWDCYVKGIGLKKDQEKAAHYQEVAANGGHEDSQFAIALRALNNKQPDKAAKWFQKAAKQGNVGATYYLGYLMFNGMGIAQDKEKAINLWEKASQKGFATADYQLGNAYRAGNGVEKDSNKAFEYIKNAAYHGNADAKWVLGNMYLNGEGTDTNFYLATQWLAEMANSSHKQDVEKLLKEIEGSTYHQYLSGLKSYYIDKDYVAALDVFKKVEKAKNTEGTAMIGLILANKDYAKQNPKKAFKTLTKATETSKVANYYLSNLYREGIGTSKDNKKALELLEKAANYGIAEAECDLGNLYMAGESVSEDLAKAAKLFLDAEAQNQLTKEAAKNLAECYKKKISTLPDLDNAEKRIEKLNKQKNNLNLYTFLTTIKYCK